jgi:hypothetical protein
MPEANDVNSHIVLSSNCADDCGNRAANDPDLITSVIGGERSQFVIGKDRRPY